MSIPKNKIQITLALFCLVLLLSVLTYLKLRPREELTFNDIATSSKIFIDMPIKLRGVISDRSQIDGIKMWPVDNQHKQGEWKEHEWFWAIPKEPTSLPDGFGGWVEYMMNRYGDIRKEEIDMSHAYLIEGIASESDCDYYNAVDGREVCIPNMVVERITK